MTFQKYMEKKAKSCGVSIYDLYNVLEGKVHVDIPETLQDLYKTDVIEGTPLAQYADNIVKLAQLRKNAKPREIGIQESYIHRWTYHLLVFSGHINLKETFCMSIKEYIEQLEYINKCVNAFDDERQKDDIQASCAENDKDIEIYISPDAKKEQEIDKFLESIAI